MLNENSSLYDIYLHFLSLTKAGAKVQSEDFTINSCLLSTPFTTAQRLSATLAIQDHKRGAEIKTPRELVAEIKQLLEY